VDSPAGHFAVFGIAVNPDESPAEALRNDCGGAAADEGI
jgi:hypothetical protein